MLVIKIKTELFILVLSLVLIIVIRWIIIEVHNTILPHDIIFIKISRWDTITEVKYVKFLSRLDCIFVKCIQRGYKKLKSNMNKVNWVQREKKVSRM